MYTHTRKPISSQQTTSTPELDYYSLLLLGAGGDLDITRPAVVVAVVKLINGYTKL